MTKNEKFLNLINFLHENPFMMFVNLVMIYLIGFWINLPVVNMLGIQLIFLLFTTYCLTYKLNLDNHPFRFIIDIYYKRATDHFKILKSFTRNTIFMCGIIGTIFVVPYLVDPLLYSIGIREEFMGKISKIELTQLHEMEFYFYVDLDKNSYRMIRNRGLSEEHVGSICTVKKSVYTDIIYDLDC